MNGYLLCVLAFATTFAACAKNWRYAFCVVIAWGYFYGILKAHFLYSGGHFIFDFSIAGFFANLLIHPPPASEMKPARRVKPWVAALVAWPVFMAILPLQHYLVQLVGLRANMLWVPLIFIGGWVDRNALMMVGKTLAFLNLIAFSFALGEFFLGVAFFVPDNEATQIVFRSNDIITGIDEERHLRIPSTFANAASYAGTMVVTVPWLLGCLSIKQVVGWLGRPLFVAGLVSALLGIFIAGSRSPVISLILVALVYFSTSRWNIGVILSITPVSLIVAFVVSTQDRFRRFATLFDFDYVSDRIQGSVSTGLLELLADYPMGRGMGAGGTNIPYWLSSYLEGGGMLVENEYVRILLEQGLPGLVIWLVFLAVGFSFKINKDDPLNVVKSLLWANGVVLFSTMWIGVGAMATVPGAALNFLSIGFAFSEPIRSGMFSNWKIAESSYLPRRSKVPAYQRGLARVLPS